MPVATALHAGRCRRGAMIPASRPTWNGSPGRPTGRWGRRCAWSRRRDGGLERRWPFPDAERVQGPIAMAVLHEVDADAVARRAHPSGSGRLRASGACTAPCGMRIREGAWRCRCASCCASGSRRATAPRPTCCCGWWAARPRHRRISRVSAWKGSGSRPRKARWAVMPGAVPELGHAVRRRRVADRAPAGQDLARPAAGFSWGG